MTGHTAAAGLVVASQCRSVSTRGRCERCGQCASRSAALRPPEGPGFGGCATAMKIPGKGVIDTEGKITHYPAVNFLQRGYFMHIREVAGATPNTVNTSVVRTRRYLTSREVERLIEAARKHGRYGHRDATMILLAYRHGLRASELCDLQWHQVELNAGRLHVRRSKRGTPSVHPMQGDEIRA